MIDQVFSGLGVNPISPFASTIQPYALCAFIPFLWVSQFVFVCDLREPT